jgi:hypothetical protein
VRITEAAERSLKLGGTAVALPDGDAEDTPPPRSLPPALAVEEPAA